MSKGDHRRTSDDLVEPRPGDSADVIRRLDELTKEIRELTREVHRVNPAPWGGSSPERSEVERLRAENDRLRVDIQGRIAEANAVRAESDMRHAQHRELAKKARDQLHSLTYASVQWPGNRESPTDQRERLRVQAHVVAEIFRLLFAPPAATETVEGWERLVDQEPEAFANIPADADDLVRRISSTPGTQRWVWDFSPPGVPFEKALYDSWTQETVGTVEFVVLPAYFVDTMMVQKPVVLVTGRE